MSSSDLWVSMAYAREALMGLGFPQSEATEVLLGCLRAGAVTGKADMFFENGADLPTEHQVTLPPDFWNLADIASPNLNLFVLPTFASWKGTKHPKTSRAWGLRVLKREIDSLLGSEDVKQKASTGRPPKLDWERCLIEGARYMVAEGVASQADVVKHLLAWCDDAVGETVMKDHVRPLYKALRSALDGQ